MKTLCIVLACSFVAIATWVRAAENAPVPTTRPSVEEENRALRSQVESQRDQIQKLSRQLRESEEELAQLKLKQRLATLQPTPRVPQAQPFSLVPSAPTLPPGSVPQQFNGSTFYLVPLAENGIDPRTLKVRTVEVQESTPANIEVRPIGTIDDRTGTTRNLIHGK